MMVSITRYATQYRDKYLSKLYDADALRNHWWNGYQFLAFSIYNQGIFEKLNNAIRNMAETAITEHIDIDSSDGVTKATDKQISDARLTFMSTRINGKTYKRKQDVELLFGVVGEDGRVEEQGILHHLRGFPRGNIIEHSITEIEEGRLVELYQSLRAFRGIGHRAAASFLRDLVDIFYDSLENHVTSIEAQTYLQPVDVWVRKVSEAVGIKFSSRSPLHQARQIAEACRQVSISKRFPISFNQGAWYFGNNSFRSAIEQLRWGM